MAINWPAPGVVAQTGPGVLTFSLCSVSEYVIRVAKSPRFCSGWRQNESAFVASVGDDSEVVGSSGFSAMWLQTESDIERLLPIIPVKSGELISASGLI